MPFKNACAHSCGCLRQHPRGSPGDTMKDSDIGVRVLVKERNGAVRADGADRSNCSFCPELCSHAICEAPMVRYFGFLASATYLLTRITESPCVSCNRCGFHRFNIASIELERWHRMSYPVRVTLADGVRFEYLGVGIRPKHIQSSIVVRALHSSALVCHSQRPHDLLTRGRTQPIQAGA